MLLSRKWRMLQLLMFDPLLLLLLLLRQSDVTRAYLLVGPFRLKPVNNILLVLVPLLLFQRFVVAGTSQRGNFIFQQTTGGSPQATLFALASVLLVRQLPLLPRRELGLLPMY